MGKAPALVGGLLETRLAEGGHTTLLQATKLTTQLLGGRPTYDPKAMVAWAKAGVNLKEPCVQPLIQHGAMPISGGSGTETSDIVGPVVEYGSGPKFANAEKLAQAYPGRKIILTESQDVGILAKRTGAYDEAVAAGTDIRLGDYNQIIRDENIRAAVSISMAPQPGLDVCTGEPVGAIRTASTMAEHTLPGGRIYVAAAEKNVAESMAAVFKSKFSIDTPIQQVKVGQLPFYSYDLTNYYSKAYVIDITVPK